MEADERMKNKIWLQLWDYTYKTDISSLLGENIITIRQVNTIVTSTTA